MKKYSWDFWFNNKKEKNWFNNVFYLYSNKKHLQNEQHHHHSKLWYWYTKKFHSFNKKWKILKASKNWLDNISIWSWCNFIDGKKEYLFYTSRNKKIGFEKQMIFLWKIFKHKNWRIKKIKKIKNFCIKPDKKFYQWWNKKWPLENIFPAFRDPFVINENWKYYMFISSRDNTKDWYNACIGLYKNSCDIENSKKWKAVKSPLSPELFWEMETSQVMKIWNYYYLFFNTWKNKIKGKKNDEQKWCYFCAKSKNIDFWYELINNKKPLLESSKYYNFRIIKYKNNILKVIWFDIKKWGFWKVEKINL